MKDINKIIICIVLTLSAILVKAQSAYDNDKDITTYTWYCPNCNYVYPNSFKGDNEPHCLETHFGLQIKPKYGKYRFRQKLIDGQCKYEPLGPEQELSEDAQTTICMWQIFFCIILPMLIILFFCAKAQYHHIDKLYGDSLSPEQKIGLTIASIGITCVAGYLIGTRWGKRKKSYIRH